MQAAFLQGAPVLSLAPDGPERRPERALFDELAGAPGAANCGGNTALVRGARLVECTAACEMRKRSASRVKGDVHTWLAVLSKNLAIF